MPNPTRSGLLVALLTLAGCPSDKGEDTDGATTGATTGDTTGDTSTEPTDGATDSASSGATESGGETDTGAPSAVDLFGCGVPAACETIFAHLDPEPASALECAARLVVSTTPGLIRGIDTPGPNIDETDYFVFSFGDGTALVQIRERHCDPNSESCDGEIPWEPSSAHQVCDLVIPDDLAGACGCGEDTCQGCSWYPMWGGLANCQPVEEYACEAVLALLP